MRCCPRLAQTQPGTHLPPRGALLCAPGLTPLPKTSPVLDVERGVCSGTEFPEGWDGAESQSQQTPGAVLRAAPIADELP